MAQVQTVDPSDTLAVLKAAREWLSDPTHFTQAGYYWSDGERPTDDRAAVRCTCVEGAMCLVAGIGEATDGPPAAGLALEVALAAIEDKPRECVCTVTVNDAPDGYERIMAGLAKAIADLEAEAAG